MKAHHYKNGKHPMLLNDKHILNLLEAKINSLDQYARIIPTRFGRRRFNKPYIKVKIDPNNNFEVFTEIGSKKVFQRFKIECSSEGGAKQISNGLKEGIF